MTLVRQSGGAARNPFRQVSQDHWHRHRDSVQSKRGLMVQGVCMHEESFIPAQGRVLCATVSLPGLRRPPPQLSLLLRVTSANPLESTFPPLWLASLRVHELRLTIPPVTTLQPHIRPLPLAPHHLRQRCQDPGRHTLTHCSSSHPTHAHARAQTCA